MKDTSQYSLNNPVHHSIDDSLCVISRRPQFWQNGSIWPPRNENELASQFEICLLKQLIPLISALVEQHELKNLAAVLSRNLTRKPFPHNMFMDNRNLWFWETLNSKNSFEVFFSLVIQKYRSTIVFCLNSQSPCLDSTSYPFPNWTSSYFCQVLSFRWQYGVTMEAVPAPVSPRVIPAYLFHQANEVFSDCSLVCWFFLVMSTSCMWHVVPWGNRARRLAPTARQTKCVCLCSSVSLRCVHRQLSEKDSMIAALWLPSCISSEFISFWFQDFE